MRVKGHVTIFTLLLFTFIPSSMSQGYCPATPLTSAWEEISSVTFAPPDYTRGETLNVSVVVRLPQSNGYHSLLGNYSYEYVNVWIDWNKNFAWDTGELLDLGRLRVQNGTPGRTVTFSGSVVVPLNAPYPTTNVRINLQWMADPPACGSWLRGDTMDLTINEAIILPVLSSLAMPTPVDPNVSYSVRFRLEDKNTLADMSYIDARMYCCASEPQTQSERNYYTFRWIPESPNGWTSTPAGFYEPSMSSFPATTSVLSFDFVLGFRLSSIAVPSGASTDWRIVIEAEDKEGNNVSMSLAFDVNKYLSYTIPSQVDLGTAEPGQSLPGGNITIVLTANTQIDVLINGSTADSDGNGIPDGNLASFDGMQWNVIPMGSFSARGSSTIPLSSSEQPVYVSVFQLGDSSNPSISGYSRGFPLFLEFEGMIPDGTPEGTYTGVWIVTVTNRNVFPV